MPWSFGCHADNFIGQFVLIFEQIPALELNANPVESTRRESVHTVLFPAKGSESPKY